MLLAQQLYYIIGKLLCYWLYYIKMITLLALIMLLVTILLVATGPLAVPPPYGFGMLALGV